MTLRGLQLGLEHLYAVETGLDVADFLLDPDALGDEALRARGETLLLAPRDDGSTQVGLWIDPETLTRLDRTPVREWVDPHALPAFCRALEGVSHFVYLAYRAAEERPVSLFEMELQAEVDKFVAAALLAREGGADARGIASLRRQMFDDAEFIDDATTEDGARYRRASRLAGKLAIQLTERLSRPSDRPWMVRLLRRFYRLSGDEKVALASREG